MPICFMLFWHWVRAAASRTFCTAGTSSAIRIAMMAMTTRSSISVKPDLRGESMAVPPERGEMKACRIRIPLSFAVKRKQLARLRFSGRRPGREGPVGGLVADGELGRLDDAVVVGGAVHQGVE